MAAERPGPDGALDAKFAFYQLGDPDEGPEFPTFSDFAVLESAGAAPRPGIVRILVQIDSCRSRLLMRDPTARTVLLNHYLLPGPAPVVAGEKVTYRAVDDYADPAHPATAAVSLSFPDASVSSYFRAKVEAAVRRNAELIQMTPVRSAEFRFDPAAPLRGIIAHLTQRCGGNVHDFGVVEVVAVRPLNRAASIADLAQQDDYVSQGAPDEWVGYDFKHMRVVPTNYTLRSRARAGWAGEMTAWIIEGSLDGDNWASFGDGREPRGFVELNTMASFPIQGARESRYVRIRRVTGSNIILSGFELFGRLIGEE
jgi:hypothetical protein